MTPEEDLSVVYENTMDFGTFKLRVISQDTFKGYLTVTRVADDLVLDEGEVTFSYEPVFGPDIQDVQTWQDRAVKAVDAHVEGSSGGS